MRLGQLARQLGIRTEDIVSFLAARDVVIEADNNARIDDAHAEWVVNKFSPVEVSTPREEPVVEVREVVTVTPEEEEVVIDPATAETIRAPKVELPGLTVLGKIELPEKKKKEVPPEEERPRVVRTERKPAHWKNPIAVQREKEQREKKRINDEELQREKQRKTEHYKKQLKPQAPTKAVRLYAEEIAEPVEEQLPEPTSLWGKFMAWLNGR